MNHLVIIGAARSGTKFLRDTLAAAPGVAVVPYDVNYIWRHGNEDHPDDALPATACTAAVGAYIRDRLLTYARRHSQLQQPALVVEKSVSNGLRVPFVACALPEARFVHLVRDGRDVVESAARMWQAPPELAYLVRKLRYYPLDEPRYLLRTLRGLLPGGPARARTWGPRYPGIDADLLERSLLEVCALQWRACVEAATTGLAALEPERCLTIRYEDLVAGPETVQRVCDFAGLEPTAAAQRLRATVRAEASGRWRSWSATEHRAVADLIDPTLARLGYQTDAQTGQGSNA
jgi:LPS sulfotransferase NodH